MNISAFKGVFPNIDLIKAPDSFFSSIKYQYNDYRTSGFYTPEKKEGIYIYKILTTRSSHTGFLCCTDIDELRNNKLLKNEKTLLEKEQHMMHLLLQRKALVKPVLLGYKRIAGIQNIFDPIIKNEKPAIRVEFTNGEIHRVWRINSKKDTQEIIHKFKSLGKAYIGDGHHRSTTVLLLNSSKELGKESRKYNKLLTAYFPFDELLISDYNRVVDISDIMPGSQFMAALSKYFDVKHSPKALKPKAKHEVTFYIDKKWYSMKWKKSLIKKESDEGMVLDSVLINNYIFGQILDIPDVRIDSRVSYYPGSEGLSKLTRQSDKKKLGIGVCIFPLTIKELTNFADQKRTLPPKTTWFIPRVKSGIIAKDL